MYTTFVGMEAIKNVKTNTVQTRALVSSWMHIFKAGFLTYHEEAERVVELSHVVTVRRRNAKGRGQDRCVSGVEETWGRYVSYGSN